MWNPRQYERFKDERKQPFHDLMALIERRPHPRIVDLGCGTGELTRELHEQLQAAETVGIDNSETMLLKSGPLGSERLRFEQGDIEGFMTDRPYDLIFSNAALHWVADHERLLRRLTTFLSPRGQLAIQMPANETHLSHSIAAEVAQELGTAPRVSDVLPPERYAELLHRLGYVRQHVRLQIYGHLLESTGAVVEWVKGTLLTDYQRRMSPPLFERFLTLYRARLLHALGDAHPYFYTYRRVLLWATF